jgi:FkbM family methyltransferase
MRNIITSWIRGRKPTSNSEDPFLVQKFIFNDAEQLIIFDVGAYIGDVTAAYKAIFPQATIYCFEPFPGSFKKLSGRADGKFVKCYQTALCEVNGSAKLQVDSDPSCNSLFPRPKAGARYYSAKARNTGQVDVETQTLDTFCSEEKISEIDILKLDVEGAEIKVLQGASEKLGKKQIKLIYTEVAFVPHYEGGCLFCEVTELLDRYDYTLFNLYNLKRARNGQLRWGNAIFAGPEIRARIETNQLQGT